eukprot:PhM_4_TR15681/c0_g1_i1/m.969
MGCGASSGVASNNNTNNKIPKSEGNSDNKYRHHHRNSHTNRKKGSKDAAPTQHTAGTGGSDPKTNPHRLSISMTSTQPATGGGHSKLVKADSAATSTRSSSPHDGTSSNSNELSAHHGLRRDNGEYDAHDSPKSAGIEMAEPTGLSGSMRIHSSIVRAKVADKWKDMKYGEAELTEEEISLKTKIKIERWMDTIVAMTSSSTMPYLEDVPEYTDEDYKMRPPDVRTELVDPAERLERSASQLNKTNLAIPLHLSNAIILRQFETQMHRAEQKEAFAELQGGGADGTRRVSVVRSEGQDSENQNAVIPLVEDPKSPRKYSTWKARGSVQDNDDDDGDVGNVGAADAKTDLQLQSIEHEEGEAINDNDSVDRLGVLSPGTMKPQWEAFVSDGG